MSMPAVEALAEIADRLDRLVGRLTRPAAMTAYRMPPVAELLLGEPLRRLSGVLSHSERPGGVAGDGIADDDRPTVRALRSGDEARPRVNGEPAERPGWTSDTLSEHATRHTATAYGPVTAIEPSRKRSGGDVAPGIGAAQRRAAAVSGEPAPDGLGPGVVPHVRAGQPATRRGARGAPDGAALGSHQHVEPAATSGPTVARGTGGPARGVPALSRVRSTEGAAPLPAGDVDGVGIRRGVHSGGADSPDRAATVRIVHSPERAADVFQANLAASPPGQSPVRPSGAPRYRPPSLDGPGVDEPATDVAAWTAAIGDPLTAAPIDDLYAALADRLQLDVLRTYGTTEA
ncbi:hypothetical protein [Humibacillus xanthopallidus]|uniref:Uncharacterized protein n=1 Tax=Humibacillus xanthopallidus TaxID=412689 RepID=A0A543HUJ6_9MICO|nr:hypothetical protein [Humibacillus xanthopallidus]TQM61939.1 hypothetical protein FBY41_1961 [Humibacillus xanthopallidus]